MDPLGLSCSSDAKKLGGRLGKAPSKDYRAHHVVMSNSKDARMRWLRRRMDRLGIDINQKENGIWLPANSKARLPNTKATAHAEEGVHGNAYKKHVWESLKEAKTKSEFEQGLKALNLELSGGKTFPLVK
nr:AHH domain-containing protein [Pseudomonas sp. FLM 11]